MKSKLVTLVVVLAALTLVASPAVAQPGTFLATGTGQGGGPHVKVFEVFSGTGALVSPTPVMEIMAYDPAFLGGVRVAIGTLVGGGGGGTNPLNLVTAPGPGGGPHIKVFGLDPLTGALLDPTPIVEFMAYDPAVTTGVNMRVCNFDGGANRALVTAPDQGGGPHIKIWDLSTGVVTLLDEFMGYIPTFTGGVRLACGPVLGGTNDSLITAPGPGGGPHIKVYDNGGTAIVSSQPVMAEFMAYTPAFTGGVYVTAGDVNGDGTADLVTAPGAGGGPHVKIWNFTDPANPAVDEEFMAYNPAFTGGVRVAASPLGPPALYTGAGPGGGPHVLGWHDADTDGNVSNDPNSASFMAYSSAFTGGVFLAVGATSP